MARGRTEAPLFTSSLNGAELHADRTAPRRAADLALAPAAGRGGDERV